MIKALDWIEREKKEHLQPVQKGVRYRRMNHGSVSAKKAILEKRAEL